jgi:hypothetical protein
MAAWRSRPADFLSLCIQRVYPGYLRHIDNAVSRYPRTGPHTV